MTSIPTLQTRRLVLRPFTPDDAPDVRRLAGEWPIADTTASIPYPYPDGAAEAWIGTHVQQFEEGSAVVFAITLRTTGELIGAINLFSIRHAIDRAEMGYWVGVPYWGLGYCTEAAKALLAYGFHELGLNRIFAEHLVRNPASGRVMEKCGMSYEGTLRQHAKKWGKYEDIKVYGILRCEFD